MSLASPPPSTAHITPVTPFIPAIKAWRIYLEDQGNSPHTVKAFVADLNLLAAYLPPDRTLGSVTTTDLNNFLGWMQKGRGVPCSPKTLARRITSLKAFFRWLHEYGVLLIDPAEKVVQRSVISPLPVVLTPDEVAQSLRAARDLWQGKPGDTRYLALLDLLLNTGIKKNETLALKLNHIDLEATDGPTLFVRYASPQHRYKERKIPLPESWTEIYPHYRDQYRLSDQLFPWSQRRLEYLLEDISLQAGVNKHISFEMCRWTSALSDWQSGMEPDRIRQKLGISKIQWREVSMKLRRLSGENRSEDSAALAKAT
jgi:integrase/recombinase XerD